MREVTDVCVVGGGPAGLTAAMTLAAAGRRVTLLESGELHSSTAAQELNEGDEDAEGYAGLVRTRHRQLGGTANTWNVAIGDAPGAKYVPLGRRDVADWPLDWDELHPWYVEAQTICGLGPFEYGAGYWATPERRPFELAGTGLETRVYQFGYASRFTDELVRELHEAEGVSVMTSATVVGLEVGEGARSISCIRTAFRGEIVEISAGSVILACGAVENARLLLLAGLGGADGRTWVGRCFMEHARDVSLVLVPYSRDLFEEAAFYDLWTSAGGFLVGGHLGLTEEALARYDFPNFALTLVPQGSAHPRQRLFDRIPQSVRPVLGLPPKGRYGWSRVRKPAKLFDRIEIVLNLEQRPHRHNRIELGERRDRFGNRLPHLTLRWTETEQGELERLRELLRESFHTADLGELLFTQGHRPDLSAHHHAGTTRMALEPGDGVVDSDCRVFGVDNLYVTGASVFRSAGFANPMLTIVALARRLGHHIAALN